MINESTPVVSRVIAASAAWGEALALLGSCCLLLTPSVMQVNLGIDSVPPNGVDGRGEVFWDVDGLQGHVKGA